jgi:hypothetical protein
MVEQDLVICRALVDIFNHPALRDNLAFRGGKPRHLPYFHPRDRGQLSGSKEGELDRRGDRGGVGPKEVLDFPTKFLKFPAKNRLISPFSGSKLRV